MTEVQQPGIEPTVGYAHLIATRTLEINLFWQRSNYFLVLNTGLAFGFFNQHKFLHTVVFAVMGVFVSSLWFSVCLGSKFWQARWEGRLAEYEREHFPTLEFFGALRPRIDADVRLGLGLDKLKGLKKVIHGWAVRWKPSVSYSMIRLALLFMIGWLVLLGSIVIQGGNPFD